MNVAGSGPRSRPSRSSRDRDRVAGPRTPSGQLSQRLVGVLAHVEVDLGDRVEPGERVRVDQQADVDAVSGRERQLLEQLTPRGDLAGERLPDRRQIGIEQVQQRAGGELGDPATAVRNGDVRRP